MSAYAALFSLKNTIHHILHSSRLSLVHPSKDIIKVLYEKLQPWERILQRLDKTRKGKSRKKVNAVDGQIKETLWNFEDLLDSLLYHQITLQSSEAEIEREVLMLFSIDLRSLHDGVDSFMQTLKDMKEEYIYEVDNMPEDEDEDESTCIISSSTSAAGYGGTKKSKMIGLSDQFESLKKSLMLIYMDWGNAIGYRLIGMAGIGKTTLAREIYEDPQITRRFDFRLWITVGRKSSPQLYEDLRSILGELKGDEKCLIVLDDVWEKTQELDSLLTSIQELKNPVIKVLLTTRDGSVHHNIRSSSNRHPELVRFLNEKESKKLLCHKVFGENIICPYQLDKAATKIAKNCEGLPLTIVTVADILSKSQNRDPQFWEDVAEERNSVFQDAYTEMSKVLFPTYDYLPQRLKMPFLYMGVFPRDYEIPRSKIINMLIAEGWDIDPDKQLSYSEDHSFFF